MSGSPLSGVRVLDLTRYIPGPQCTQILADLGADVVKLEAPPQGDPARAVGPFSAGESALHAALNRGKRSIVVDLRRAEGAAIARRLASRCDVLVDANRPGALARRGLGPERLLRDNPRLVYCALSGWGPAGEMAGRPAHDVSVLARSGLLAMLRAGPRARPAPPAVQLVDGAGGLAAALGVLAALMARERDGRGQVVEVSLLDAALALGASALARRRGDAVPRDLAGSYACYNVYRCRDGRFVSVGALEPKLWEALCRALGCEDRIPHQWSRGEERRRGLAAVGAAFGRRDRAAWLEVFAAVEACVEPVLEPGEALDQPPAAPLLVEQPWGGERLRVPGLPFRIAGAVPPRPAPGTGEHTDELLGELGLGAEEIRALRAQGAVA